jgi:hypothetical protein
MSEAPRAPDRRDAILDVDPDMVVEVDERIHERLRRRRPHWRWSAPRSATR